MKRAARAPLRLALLVGALLVTTAPGCRTVYVDSPAPPGTVPPAPIPATRADPGTTVRERGELATEAPPAAAPSGSGAAPVSTEGFADAYAAKGKPRMAIFLDRELSGRVEEWNEVLGLTRSRSSDELKLQDDEPGDPPSEGWSTRERTAGEVVNVTAGRAADGTRATPASEGWRWRLAQGFQEEMLAVPVTLVDRATIVRLGAADAVREGPEYAGLANKKVEIDALRSHADILVELLVTRDPPPAGPTLFRVTAKDVSRGTLIATVTRSAEDLAPGRFVAGPGGYERAPASPEDAGRALARELMAALGRRWR